MLKIFLGGNRLFVLENWF